MQRVFEYIAANETRYLEELKELIAIPSISTEPGRSEDVRRCARWLAAHLEAIGLQQVRVCPTQGHPIVYAEHTGSPNGPTLLVYGHYDVQPVEPLELWSSPPFEMSMRDGRLYGRGTADDKGQFFIHCKAMEAFLRTAGSLPVNIKILIEGEEESGGGNLLPFIRAHSGLLRADLAVISDTPFFAPGVPSICYGMRGITAMQIDLEGPNKDLHSGVYGGSVLNPVQELGRILAALHDGEGRVAIPGFYDSVRPITPIERHTFGELPWDEDRYARDLGVRCLHGETGFSTLERIWTRPTLEVNGIWGGYAGEGMKSIIPSRAGAKISMRLVPDQDPEAVARAFADRVAALAHPAVKLSVTTLTTASPAATDVEGPGMRAALAALETVFAVRPLFHRDGGTIPVVAGLKDILGMDTVLLGFGLPDENAHAPDEFLDLAQFFQGIRTVAVFYQEAARRLAGPTGLERPVPSESAG